jgi:hypothetical protein
MLIGALLLAIGCASSWPVDQLSLSFEDLCRIYIGAGVAFLGALGTVL